MSERRGGALVLAGLAVAVAAVLVFLIISAKSGGSSSPGASSGSKGDGAGIVAEAQAARGETTAPRRMKGSDDASRSRPRIDDSGDYRDYIKSDGARLRDHRTGDHPEPDLDRPAYVRKTRARVSADVIMAVRRWLRPQVTQCSRDYEADIGDDAKVDVRLQVSITSGALTVGKTVIKPKNVSGEDFRICVEQRVRNMELSVQHDEDVEHHMLTFPFSLPVK